MVEEDSCTMVRYCCISICPSKKDPAVLKHALPRDLEARRIWVQRIHCPSITSDLVTQTNKFVCHLHFHKDTISKSSNRLIPGSLPVYLMPSFHADPNINCFLNSRTEEYNPAIQEFVQSLRCSESVPYFPDQDQQMP